MPQRPCLTCGELSPNSYCDDHAYRRDNSKRRPYTAHQMGYGYRWQQLSKQARQKQPFCLDCGSTYRLTADHTDRAWQRVIERKPIRLQDIDVVCEQCNIKRGKKRPDALNPRHSRDGGE